MPQQVNPPVPWRDQVKEWLAQVSRDARFTRQLGPAAKQRSRQFPKRLLFALVRAVLPQLAKWMLKSVLRDVAGDLGIALTNEELDVLAEIALAAV